MEAGTKPAVLRMLFTLGLLSKHFDVESEELREFKVCTKQDLFDIFLYFVRNFDVDVQQKALNGLGSFLTRYSEYMMRDEIKSLYMDCMRRPDAPINLKSQVNSWILILVSSQTVIKPPILKGLYESHRLFGRRGPTESRQECGNL